jgi:putative heme-binding domain-containing protein
VSEQASGLFPAPPPSGHDAKRVEVERVRRVVDAAPGDPYKGEAIFTARCAACHTLFFKGGHVGPNLTTYQREDLGSMLPSIIDPSLEVREGFETYVLRTKDGRTLSGYLVEKDPAVVVIRGTDGQDVRVSADRIAKMKPTGTSLMPESILDGLDDTQLRDFFAFLRIPQPISQ